MDSKWTLLKWALAHDLKPSTLLKATGRAASTYWRIFVTSCVYGPYSLARLLLLPLEPVRVLVKTTFYVLFQTDRVRAVKHSLEAYRGRIHRKG